MSRREWRSVWFLVRDIVKRERGRLVGTVIMAAMGAVLPYIGIVGMGRLLDGAAQGAGDKTLYGSALAILLATFLVTLIFEKASAAFWQKMDYTKDLEAREMNARSLSMDYEYLEDVHVQELRSRTFSKSFFGIRGWFLWHFRYILETVFSFLLTMWLFLPALVQQAENSRRMLWLFTGLSVLAGMMVWVNYRTGIRSIRRIDTIYNTMDGLFHKKRYYGEMLSEAETQKDLRINAWQTRIDQEMGRICGALKEKQYAQNRLHEKRKVTALATSGLTGLAAYLFVGMQAHLGLISTGSVVVCAAAVIRLMESFNYFGISLGHMKQMAMFAGDYAEYMGLERRKYAGSIPLEKRRDNRFSVSFEHVSFRYPGTDRDVIRDLTISFEIGGRMALVGRNGSGKSTFIKLLCRLYDVTQGVIKVNGIDIRKYDPAEYSRLFAVVFQDFSILAFPLGENIAASKEMDKARVREALERVGLGERAAELREGLDTCVGKEYRESGVTFSSGEKQKMAIARAIYKDAPFVIMDEPTAALDPKAECEVFAGFDKMVGSRRREEAYCNKTALYISHRLASCRFCEDILVFDQGRVIQRGSHERLREQEGLYRELWEAQARYYGQEG